MQRKKPFYRRSIRVEKNDVENTACILTNDACRRARRGLGRQTITDGFNCKTYGCPGNRVHDGIQARAFHVACWQMPEQVDNAQRA